MSTAAGRSDPLARVRLAARGLSEPPLAPAWNAQEIADLMADTAFKAAAVLVPLVVRGADVSVVLTRRTETLSQHAGQVSFPGGRIEADDKDAIAAALRETYEEIGIRPDLVSPFGYLDRYDTITGFSVTPVLGLVDAEYQAAPDLVEVAEVFEVPLDFLLDPANLRENRLEYRGRERRIYTFDHGTHRIWGATAAMLVNLIERLRALP